MMPSLKQRSFVCAIPEAFLQSQNRKARTELSTYRGGQKLLGQNDFTHAAQPSRDAAWRRYELKT